MKNKQLYISNEQNDEVCPEICFALYSTYDILNGLVTLHPFQIK